MTSQSAGREERSKRFRAELIRLKVKAWNSKSDQRLESSPLVLLALKMSDTRLDALQGNGEDQEDNNLFLRFLQERCRDLLSCSSGCLGLDTRCSYKDFSSSLAAGIMSCEKFASRVMGG